jgi:hypothetical protein
VNYWLSVVVLVAQVIRNALAVVAVQVLTITIHQLFYLLEH